MDEETKEEFVTLQVTLKKAKTEEHGFIKALLQWALSFFISETEQLKNTGSGPLVFNNIMDLNYYNRRFISRLGSEFTIKQKTVKFLREFSKIF